MSDAQTIFVRANKRRKSHGGIWRAGRFITLGWHEIEVSDDERIRFERDRNIEVSEDIGDEEFVAGAIGSKTSFGAEPKAIDQLRKDKKKGDKKGDAVERRLAEKEAQNNGSSTPLPEDFPHLSILSNDSNGITTYEQLAEFDSPEELDDIGDTRWNDIQEFLTKKDEEGDLDDLIG